MKTDKKVARALDRPSGINSLSEKAAYTGLLLPFMVLFTIFTIIPVFSSIVLSFFDYDQVSTPIWVGLENYLRMVIGDRLFPIVFKNTLVMAVILGPLSYILAFVLAWCISEFRPVVRTFLAFLFYAPGLVGNAYFVWSIIFSGDAKGYANSILLSLGLINDPIVWFKNLDYNMGIIIIIQLWMSLGVSFLSNIAGIQNVPHDMYEAGAIDGIRNRWQELWYITLPSMKSILLFGAVMQIQSSFSIGAVITALVGYPTLNNSLDTIVTYLQDVGTQRYEFGYAAAISVVLFLMMLLFRVLVGNLLNLLGK
ncbi:MAG: sugar ABC transporter permease [Clostridia bacterium]|nr:sugar ABC transporter permease [Clostridia bacterium]